MKKLLYLVILCIPIVKEKFTGKRIGYPAIGTGLAGGNWEVISKIIEEELDGEAPTFVEFFREKT